MCTVQTLARVAKRIVREIPQVIDYKTGAVKYEWLLSGAKVHLKQLPRKFCLSARQQIQNMFVLISSINKDGNVSCLLVLCCPNFTFSWIKSYQFMWRDSCIVRKSDKDAIGGAAYSYKVHHCLSG